MPKSPLSLKPVPFEQAVQALAKRTIQPPQIYYGSLQGIERTLAFSVAGITALDQLQQTLDSLDKAAAAGMSFEQWRREALKAPDVAALPRHRLDNIFRTNIQGAYARGRCVHIANNQAARPFLMYSAINDSRVRPHHLAMDGYVAEVGAAVWNKWTPPAGYRCRCTVHSLTAAQAESRKKAFDKALATDTDRAQALAAALAGGPDPGWDYSPCEELEQHFGHAGGKSAGPKPGAKLADVVAQKADAYHPALAEKARELPKKAAEADPLDTSRWKRISGAKGSNDGGLFEAPDGTKFYVKRYTDPNQARTEAATNRIMNLIGIDTPRSYLLTMNGDLVIANKWRDDFTKAAVSDLHRAKHKVELRRIYQAAALLRNWDVVGLDIDNIVLTRGGKLAVVDNGGTLKFRAQGGAKPYQAGPVEDLNTLLDPAINRQAAEVFGKYSADELLIGLKSNFNAITRTQLAKIFSEAGFEAKEAAELTATTWARVKWMRSLADSRRATPSKAGTYTGLAPAFKDAAAVTPADARIAFHSLGESSINRLLTKGSKAKKLAAYAKASKEHLAHVIWYTGAGYASLNKALFKGTITSEIIARKNALNAALLHSQKYTGTSRRGIHLDIQSLKEWKAAAEKAQQTGAPLEFKSFMSTATYGEFGGNVKINVTGKGHQGVFVDPISQHRGENEVLYAAGSRFRVTKHEWISDLQRLELWVEEDASIFTKAPAAKLSTPSPTITKSQPQG